MQTISDEEKEWEETLYRLEKMEQALELIIKIGSPVSSSIARICLEDCFGDRVDRYN